MWKMRRSIVFGLGVMLGALAAGTWVAYGQEAASGQSALDNQRFALAVEISGYLLGPSAASVRVADLPGDWQAKLQQLLDVDGQLRGRAEPAALAPEATLTATSLPDGDGWTNAFNLVLTMPSSGGKWIWSCARSTGPPKGPPPDGLPGFAPLAEEGQQ